MTRTMLAVAMTLALADCAAGQGLADAAKRAEEQRKGNTTPSITLRPPTEPEDESQPPRLTAKLVSHYAEARMALRDRRAADPKMQLRLLAATRNIQAYIDLADILASEPTIVNLFDYYELTPRTYVRTEIMLLIAQSRHALRFEKWPGDPPSERVRENVAFYERSKSSVDAALNDCFQHEVGLKIWGWAPPPLPKVAP